MDVPSQGFYGRSKTLFRNGNPNEWIGSLVKELIETNSWKTDIRQKNKCYIMHNFKGNRQHSDPAIFKITDLTFCIKMRISQENLLKYQSSTIDSFRDWDESTVMLTKYQLNYSLERNAENSSVFLDIFFDIEEFHTEGVGLADIDNSQRYFPWCTEISVIRTELFKAAKILGLLNNNYNAEPSISDNSIIIDDDEEIIVIDQNSTNEDVLLIANGDLNISNEEQAALDEIAEWKSDYCPLSSLEDIDSTSSILRMQTDSEDMGATCDLLLQLMDDSEEKKGSQLPCSNKKCYLSQNQFTESESQRSTLNLKRNLGKNRKAIKENSLSNENVAMEINVIPVCETEEINENQDMDKALICSKCSSDDERPITIRQTQRQQSASLPKRLNLIETGIKELVLPEEMTKTLWNNLFAIQRNKF